MAESKPKVALTRGSQAYKSLANQFLNLANRGIPQFDFFKEMLEKLMHFSKCDALELWLREEHQFNHYTIEPENPYKYETFSAQKNGDNLLPEDVVLSPLGQVASEMFRENPGFPEVIRIPSGDNREYGIWLGDQYQSYIHFTPCFGDEHIGLIQLLSLNECHFGIEDEQFYQLLAHDLGVAIINHRIQAALRERVKELSCLYKIAQVTENPDIEFSQALHKIMEHIQPAWQYPEITQCRIILDGKEYISRGFKQEVAKQTADIYVQARSIGTLEVSYTEKKAEIYEGPFLREERNLIDTIAAQIAILVERRQAEKDRLELQAQLRHADRLATIGQLAAGVAHELNEPLGNILGFSQLTKKCADLPEQAAGDLDKIINASLHAREVIKKLMLFARQLPPQSSKVNLNDVVTEGLYFFEARCDKSGIELIRDLTPDLKYIIADKSQLNQVLVNLVVNSIQAMPNGGKLTIRTQNSPGRVSLIVEDTGSGMNEEVLGKIFIPFFTTKEVNEGTGLGLAVVHGIVTAHRGKINVFSTVNQGTLFNIQFKI